MPSEKTEPTRANAHFFLDQLDTYIYICIYTRGGPSGEPPGEPPTRTHHEIPESRLARFAQEGTRRKET